jgi:hypothetical protein
MPARAFWTLSPLAGHVNPMNAKIALALVALLALGAAVAPTAVAAPTCQDLAGNGSACVDGTNVDVVADSNGAHLEAHVHVTGP